MSYFDDLLYNKKKTDARAELDAPKSEIKIDNEVAAPAVDLSTPIARKPETERVDTSAEEEMVSAPGKEEEESVSDYNDTLFDAINDVKIPTTRRDYIEQYADKPMSNKEREELDDKHRKRSIATAISDGLSALANLYFTNQYAPSVDNRNNLLTERAKAAYDRLIKDDKDNRRNYYNLYFNAREGDLAEGEREKGWRARVHADRLAAKDREYAKARQKALDDNNAAYQGKKLDIAEKQAEAAHTNAKARLSAASGKKTDAGQGKTSGGSGTRYRQSPLTDKDGSTVYIFDNVYDLNASNLFEMIAKEEAAAKGKDYSATAYNARYDTREKRKLFIEQNWHKYDKAREYALKLSKLPPYSDESSLVDNDELLWGVDNNELDW